MTKVANSRSGEWQFGGRSRILFSSRTNKRTASVRRRRGNDEAALQVVVSLVCNATQSGSLCFELGWRLMKSIFYFISQVWKLCKTVAAFEVLSLMRLNLVILNILIKLQVCFIFIETKKSRALILKNIQYPSRIILAFKWIFNMRIVGSGIMKGRPRCFSCLEAFFARTGCTDGKS